MRDWSMPFVSATGIDLTPFLRIRSFWPWAFGSAGDGHAGDSLLRGAIHELCHARGFGIDPFGQYRATLSDAIEWAFDVKALAWPKEQTRREQANDIREIADTAASFLAMDMIGVRYDRALIARMMGLRDRWEGAELQRHIDLALMMPRQRRLAEQVVKDLWRAAETLRALA